MTDVYYINTFNDPDVLSNERFYAIWEVELVRKGNRLTFDTYRFVRKVYDPNNKLNKSSVIDPAPALIVHGKLSLITRIFEGRI